ncbi:MAG: hypothetical protein WC663_02155 [Patescibacteria group bacterium]|jgi:hypothetical protein
MKDFFPKAFRIFMVAVILVGGALWLDYEAKKDTKEQSALGSIIKAYKNFTQADKKVAKKKKKKKSTKTNTEKTSTNTANPEPEKTTTKKKTEKTTQTTENATTQDTVTAPKDTGGYIDDSIKEKARQEALNAAKEIYNQTSTQQ